MMQCSKPTTVSPTLIAFGPVNAPTPRTTWTLRCLASLIEPAGQPPHDVVLPRAHLVDVDRRLAERDAGVASSSDASVSTLATCSSALDGMQPTFRQTPPSRLAAVDQRDGEPEIGGAERGRVTARAGAEHRDLDLDVRVVGDPGRTERDAAGHGRLGGPGAVAVALGGLLGRGLGGVEREDHGSFGDLVADGDLDLADLARGGRGNLHRRLVGLQHDQGRLDVHLVAGGDEDLDDGNRVEIADVRDADFHQSSTLLKSESWFTRWATKRAASAPSITRWS